MYQSMVHLLLHSIEKFPDKNALLFKKDGNYTGITYAQLGEAIKNLAHGLLSLDLQACDRVAILSYNRPEWPICDFAIFSMRGLVVPIYHTLPANQIAYILNDAGVRAIFVEDEEQFNKIVEINDKLNGLEFIFPIKPVSSSEKNIVSYQELLNKGDEHRKRNPDAFQQMVDEIDPEEICSLVYTSGTTGNPKGVMLHHKGFVMDVINSEGVFGILPEDVFLSFLPLSHLYERLGGHWCPLYKGATIGYADSIATVVDDIQKVRPTVMVSVPRLYEKISSSVLEQVESGSTIKQKIFYWALKTGRRYQEKKRNNAVNKTISWKNNIAEKLVFSKVKEKLGGRFRFPISGGAPLSTETLKFFEAMGLQIVEGYGMTETHLIITLTPPGSTKYGSCGKPIPGVEVKIAEDGEILVKGDTLMRGYYNQPELTGEMIDKDGWLHTGDIGYMDEDNYLYITDRKKNILVTAGGKNIAPAPIENALKLSKYVDEICLIGDKRKFVSALIVPNYEVLLKWAAEQGLSEKEISVLIKNEAVIQMLETEIENLQKDFARFERIKKFILLPEPLSIEKGELTPSLKVKRNVVEEKYKSQIDQLYGVGD